MVPAGLNLKRLLAYIKDKAGDQEMAEKCVECGRVTDQNRACEYCRKTYCETHMPQHLAWERRHENLAEDASRLWKRRKTE